MERVIEKLAKSFYAGRPGLDPQRLDPTDLTPETRLAGRRDLTLEAGTCISYALVSEIYCYSHSYSYFFYYYGYYYYYYYHY